MTETPAPGEAEPAAETEIEPEPLRYTGHLIRRAQQRHAALWNALVSAEVSSVQFAALTLLERMPGASQAELGAALDLDRSTIADLVARLERRGAVERTPHASDRRRNAVRLTAAGADELARLRPLARAANDALAAPLDERELAALRALLRRLLEG
jgi:MarR family transcriptional regulator, temperature-dependent positive regulator of motility